MAQIQPSQKVTDAQIVADWPGCPSISALAGKYSMSVRRLSIRVAKLRDGGFELPSPDTRSPSFGSGKFLMLDIETAPNLAYVWGTWKQNINPEWIAANGYVMCWTAKWRGEKKVYFKKLEKGKPLSLLEPIHRLLSEAHAVVHYNGIKFDIPTLNKEFLTHGMQPPAPYKQVDLLKTMRDGFRFPSNKLDYVVQTLGIGEKIRHAGPQLWLDCMADKPDAWKRMEEYNRHDVTLLEKLYNRLLPWIKGHPNAAAFMEDAVCTSCGSYNFKQDKTHMANVLRYKRYQCSDCGTWFRGNKTVTPRTKEERHLPAI